MAIDMTSDFPLLIIGTDVLTNPSFESWSSATDCDDWTETGTLANTTDTDLVHPVGFRSAVLTSGDILASTTAATYALFGVSSMPNWADGFIAVCAYNRTAASASGYLKIGTTSGSTFSTTTGQWLFGYVEASAPGTLYVYGPSTGTLYVDSIMCGFYIDLNIYFEKWNPVDRTKKEDRETPYNVLTQLYSDALDLKAETIKFDTTLREKFLGAWQYLQKGHYFGCILDRGNSAPYRDEWMPYLALDSQDTPKFYAGAPDVFTLGINGRGCLP